MLLNHFKIAIRNLLRDHVYSIINVGGLAVGIAASVLLSLLIAGLTISFQTIRAAMGNPVESLRTE